MEPPPHQNHYQLYLYKGRTTLSHATLRCAISHILRRWRNFPLRFVKYFLFKLTLFFLWYFCDPPWSAHTDDTVTQTMENIGGKI